MDGGGRHAVLLKVFHHLVGAMLGAGEHEGAALGNVAEQIEQHAALLRGFAEDHRLLDLLHRGGGRRHRHMHGIAQHRRREARDLLRHCRREEQRLPLGGDVGDDTADRNDEAEIEHVVGLVEHQHLGEVEANGAVLHVVHQAAGRGDKHVNAAGHGAGLLALRHAAEHRGHAHADELAVGTKTIGDLAGQFPRRRQHEHAAGAAHGRAPLGRQALEDGEGKGRRLAGAGLGDALDVPPVKRRRDRLLLDRRGSRVALGFQRLEKGRAEAE